MEGPEFRSSGVDRSVPVPLHRAPDALCKLMLQQKYLGEIGSDFDRGVPCTSDDNTGSSSAVFVLKDGTTLSNVIIGANALEGVHCLSAYTIRNVWFRDVCEDAISILGRGNALIEGGGAQNGKDKVVQHNGRGTVTIKDYTVVTAGKLYRGCGNCSNNGGPRNVIIQNVKTRGIKQLVGINSNYGDTATISNACGAGTKACQEFEGIEKDGKTESPEVDTTASCTKGPQGLGNLPSC